MALSLSWAYTGILAKHLSPVPTGFAKAYPVVIITTVICIIIFVAATAYIDLTKTQTTPSKKTN